MRYISTLRSYSPAAGTSGGRGLGLISWGLSLVLLSLSIQATSASSFIDRLNAVANNEGRELAAVGNEAWQIGDLIPVPPMIKTVGWTLGGAGLPLTINGNAVMSVAPPGGAAAAIQNALNTIQNNTNNLLFTPGANAAAFNPNVGADGNTIDLFFANFAAAGLPNVLGGAFLGQAVGVAAGGTFTANHVDLVLDTNLTVFNPGAAPPGFFPVVNPLVNPYATFTGTGNAGASDIESTVLHEVMHALGLQHPDRAIQNINSNARFTRNYQTALGIGTVTAGLSFVINEDNFFNSGLIRTQEGAAAAVGGEPFTVNPNRASSSVMNSIAGVGEINRTITPDDIGGLAFAYQDTIAQGNANTIQTATAAQYAGVVIESDFSFVGGSANTWNDVPAQATRNDLVANAQVVGAVPNVGTMQILGSIAGRTSGAQSGQQVVPGVFNSGDVDYYQLSALGGSQLLFDLDEGHMIGNSLDAAMEIFNAAGAVQLAVNDDDVLNWAVIRQGSLSNLDPALVFTVPGVGVQNFLLKVSAVGTMGLSEGDYLVNIMRVPEPATLCLAIAMGLAHWARRKPRAV